MHYYTIKKPCIKGKFKKCRSHTHLYIIKHFICNKRVCNTLYYT